MPITIAIESPLEDDVRALIATLNDYLLPLTPPVGFKRLGPVLDYPDVHGSVFYEKELAKVPA